MNEAPQTPLRQVRIAAGLSLRETARRAGINPGRLSIIERGVSPTADEAARILAALQPSAVRAATETPSDRDAA